MRIELMENNFQAELKLNSRICTKYYLGMHNKQTVLAKVDIYNVQGHHDAFCYAQRRTNYMSAYVHRLPCRGRQGGNPFFRNGLLTILTVEDFVH
jgi:hypothetical protein